MRTIVAMICAAQTCGATPVAEPRATTAPTVTSTEVGEPAIASLDAPVLAVSGTHGCLATRRGALFCWGDNTFGQLGVPGSQASAVRVPGIAPVRDVATNLFSTCVCDVAGMTHCWGFDGETPQRPTDQLARARRIDVPACQAVSAGHTYACSLGRDGVVRCWGDHPGPAGSPPPLATDRPGLYYEVPQPIPGLPPIRSVTAGSHHACAIGADGKSYCWSDSDQLGETSNGLSHNGIVEPPISGVREFAAAFHRTCALTDDGTLYCWGYDPIEYWRTHEPNDYTCETAGADSHCRNAAPEIVSANAPGSLPTLGFGRVCVLGTNGELACWPRLPTVEGLPTTGLAAAVLARDGSFVRDIPMKNGGCVLTTDGQVYCWSAEDSLEALDLSARITFTWTVPSDMDN